MPTPATESQAGNQSPIPTATPVTPANPPTTPVSQTPSEAPEVPLILQPGTGSIVTNSQLTISGTCVSGLTVRLDGNVLPSEVVSPISGSLTQLCLASAFSFTVSKTVSGVYSLSVTQTNVEVGLSSTSASINWIYDNVVPAAIVVTQPAGGSARSSDSSFNIAGICEAGAQILLSGTRSATINCVGGTFSYNFNIATDGIYNWSIVQRDAAGNQSSSVAVSWQRDSSAPVTPGIVSPLNNTYSANSSVTISGGCTTGFQVSLSGDVVANEVASPAGSLSAVCQSGSYSFNINKLNDGAYTFNVTQSDPVTFVQSATASTRWNLDMSAPQAVQISQPVNQRVRNSASQIEFAGVCEMNATVTISGASSAVVPCANGAFSYVFNSLIDGSYSWSVAQTDRAGNSSQTIQVEWIRDTVAPVAPTITSPLTNSYSRQSSVTITGGCSTGNLVILGGEVLASEVTNPAASLQQACVGSSYSFEVLKATDAVYDFSVTQNDQETELVSAPALVRWIRDTTSPAAIEITQPIGRFARSSASQITISGRCEQGSVVSFSGAETLNISCVNGAFSHDFSSTTDATYDWSIIQTDLAGNSSIAASVQWIRDTSLPVTPVILSPAAVSYSQLSIVTITGTCVSGQIVELSGSVQASDVTTPIGSLAMSCVASAFSFTVQKLSDGSYDFYVRQTDAQTLVSSAPATVRWIRDTLAPVALVFNQPSGGMATNGDSVLNVALTCEAGSTVMWTGSTAGSGTCSSVGSFATSMAATTDGSYAWSFTQLDRAGNQSVSASLVWNRDTTIPQTPNLLSPASAIIVNSAGSLTITVSCVTDNLVSLTGSVSASEITSPAGSLTSTCVAGSSSFTISKTADGTYALGVFQTNTSGFDSAVLELAWTRDTVAPSAVTMTSPLGLTVSSPQDLNISGHCESLATILITGANSAQTICLNGSFSVTLTAAADGVYPVEIRQRDGAGNLSIATTFTWTRDASTPATPVITSPSTSTYVSNINTLALLGQCTPGYQLQLSGLQTSMIGSPAGALTQACPVSGAYSWSVAAPSDGTFQVAITQSNGIATSAPVALTWIVDTVAPVVALTGYPSNPSLSDQATFAFASQDLSARFRCALDNAAEVTCSSPVIYSGLSNATHTFKVIPYDEAGNVGASVTWTWNVNSRKTIALYHFDSAPGHLVDSSGFTGVLASDLTVVGSVSSATGKFGQADVITSSSYLATPHNAYTHNLGTSTMTIEAYIKLTSFPTSYYTIASKTGTTNELGWKFQILKTGSSSRALTFNVSTNGTTWGAEAVSSKCAVSTTNFVHVAVTWNKGSVTFYCGGAMKGTRTIGVAGSTVIYPSAAPLYVGSLGGTTNALMTVDELRISKMVRYTTSFPAPTSAFAGD